MPLRPKPCFLTFEDVNIELGKVANTTVSLNDTDVRNLANITTSNTTISFDNLFDTSTLFGQQGAFYCGGWYIGTLASTGSATQTHHMLLAPVATGTTFNVWLTTYSVGTSGSGNFSIDGFDQTNNNNNGNHPILQWARSLNINGYSDWFVPSGVELDTIFNNRANINTRTPAEGLSGAYWSSTRSGYYSVYAYYFGSGAFSGNPLAGLTARAVRRELIT